MKIHQSVLHPGKGWDNIPDSASSTGLVLAFGGVDRIADPEVFELLRSRYPEATLIQVSTAGEIAGSRVLDETVVCTHIQFSHTPFRVIATRADEFKTSADCGDYIGKRLLEDDLKHILVLSEGTQTNGDLLVEGLRQSVGEQVLITGGLAADAGRFEKTFVGVDAPAKPGVIAAIGFYGNHLRVAHGSRGGWDPFGPMRKVTKSHGNVLLELDGRNALELYKTYLGDKSDSLPGSALLFPLCIVEGNNLVVRTILNIDESAGSMTFAGDIPQGATVQFMMANFDRLIDGAATAAVDSSRLIGVEEPELVLMVSCVGRKIVLGPRIEEEVESVVEVFGGKPVYCGFYSNGEISPVTGGTVCSLHNQTMTITTYSEYSS
jgi:hypothetical protein